jgi:pimeloyl-ACP methyl ester carboxylesterase
MEPTSRERATVTDLRRKVSFRSGDGRCIAWHYPGTNGACIVMAGGMAVTKEPATDLFAAKFHDAGYSVVAFDYRRIGESDGTPRQVVRVKDHVADWHAAVAFAATLEEVDSGRIAIWGFSFTGGVILQVAAASRGIAAAIAQAPAADGQAATRNASRHQKPRALLRFMDLAVADAIGSLFRRPPILIPLAGNPGEVAMLTTPDAMDGERAFDAGVRYPDWRQQVAARSALRAGFYRPGRYAKRIEAPLLVVVSDRDESALAKPAMKAARRAPRGELVQLSGGHYAAFLEQHDAAFAAELAFLRRHDI